MRFPADLILSGPNAILGKMRKLYSDNRAAGAFPISHPLLRWSSTAAAEACRAGSHLQGSMESVGSPIRAIRAAGVGTATCAKVGMATGALGRKATSRVVDEQLVEEIEPMSVEAGR